MSLSFCAGSDIGICITIFHYQLSIASADRFTLPCVYPRFFRNFFSTKPQLCALYLTLMAAVTLQPPVASGSWQDALRQSEIVEALELADLTINTGMHLPTDTQEAEKTSLQQTSAQLLGTQLLLVELKEQKQ